MADEEPVVRIVPSTSWLLAAFQAIASEHGNGPSSEEQEDLKIALMVAEDLADGHTKFSPTDVATMSRVLAAAERRNRKVRRPRVANDAARARSTLVQAVLNLDSVEVQPKKPRGAQEGPEEPLRHLEDF